MIQLALGNKVRKDDMLLKRLLKSLVYRGCYLSRYHSLLLHRIKKQNVIPILSLHRVSPRPNYFWSPLTPVLFDDMLTFLKKHFHLVTLHEIDEINSKKPKLVLSFDDGYYDFIEYAMPILDKHGVKANHNIIPSQLLGEKALWNIALYDFFQAAPPSLLKEVRFNGFDAKAYIGRNVNKIKLGLHASRALKKLTCAQRAPIIHHLETRFFSQLGPYETTRMIRLHEMNDLLNYHEIGVHSYWHNNMGNESMEYFIDDFKLCQAFFQNNSFPPLDIYAFPNGSYRQEQIDYLKNNHIKHVLLVDDQYANAHSPHSRFNIAAFDKYEVIFQALGINTRRQ